MNSFKGKVPKIPSDLFIKNYLPMSIAILKSLRVSILDLWSQFRPLYLGQNKMTYRFVVGP